MDYRGLCVLVFSFTAVGALPRIVLAGGFEGVIKLDSITVPKDQLAGVVEGGTTNVSSAEKVFAIPLAKIEALKGKPGVYTQETTISIKGSKARVDGLGKQMGYMITDLDQGTSDVVMPERKQYVQWTKGDAQALAARMEDVQKAMKERMATLPPEQRQQMEAMMKNMKGMSPVSTEKPDVTPLGKTQTINGMQTQGYVVHTANEAIEGWVSQDPPELATIIKSLQGNLQGGNPMGGPNRRSARAILADYGIPVREQVLSTGSYQIEELVDVQKKSVSADLFTVPAGFEKVAPHQQMMPPGHPPMGMPPAGQPPAVPGAPGQ